MEIFNLYGMFFSLSFFLSLFKYNFVLYVTFYVLKKKFQAFLKQKFFIISRIAKNLSLFL